MTINKSILISAPAETVYGALTNAREIIEYYPLNEVISDWQVGGDVLFKGDINGQAFTDYGVIEALEQPRVFKYRYWSTNHGTERTPENYQVITYALCKEDSGTRLNLTHDNIRSPEMFEIMNSVVWDGLLGALKEHVEAAAR